ncbi:hypothetical protein BYT27DRAFT_7199806 [Phlegmacium glaucopus]|nr:hypothetical protein BYT27DRAFT_7199806 [Phlegmacium glaucopus]
MRVTQETARCNCNTRTGGYEGGSVRALSVFDDFRVRILPVLGPFCSILGLNAATFYASSLGRHL